LTQSKSSLPSAWTPLLHSLFRWLWIASVVSNVGTWMQNVGAACVGDFYRPAVTRPTGNSGFLR